MPTSWRAGATRAGRADRLAQKVGGPLAPARGSTRRELVHTIGQYDFSAGTLVNRDLEKPRYTAGGLVFDGWGGSAYTMGNKHFRFDVTNPRQEGLEFEFKFKAKQIGIYTIKAERTLRDTEQVIESNPVILTVSPPLDKKGKPIIKEEWIDPIAWRYRPR